MCLSRFNPAAVPTHIYPSRPTPHDSTKLSDNPLLAVIVATLPPVNITNPSLIEPAQTGAVRFFRQGSLHMAG